MIADYHTHTPLCHHAEGEPESFVDAALAAGLREYGISDHAPHIPEPFDDWRMLESELPAYYQFITRAKNHAEGRLPIRAGLECDWLPGCESWIESLAARYPWDYLIGSVHYLGKNFDFDNPKWLGRWSELDVEETWSAYWKEYENLARSGLFDILAHPDLIKKFSYAPAGDLRPYYEPVIRAIADCGSAIELNTAGWHKPCAEQYPARPFLEMAAEANIPIVISSDAHRPEEVARDFPKAITLLKECGFKNTLLFDQRKKTWIPF